MNENEVMANEYLRCHAAVEVLGVLVGNLMTNDPRRKPDALHTKDLASNAMDFADALVEERSRRVTDG